MGVVPESWMPAVKMTRIHLHWTAGTYKANATDRAHYHILIEGDGTIVRARPSIKLNEPPPKAGYAAHTLNANSGAIGVSMCAMSGAVEAPFRAGAYPLTEIQWKIAVQVVADLCRRYAIAVTPKTVLTHAEVQANLGIRQKNKWDIARLPFEPARIGAKAVGARLRLEVDAALRSDPATLPRAALLESGGDPITEIASARVYLVPPLQADRPAWGVKLFRHLGWPRMAAIALIARAQQEAYKDLRTEAKGDPHLPGHSVGLFQWNNGSKGQFTRQTDFYAFCKSVGLPSEDFEANIRFADHELRSTESSWGKLLMSAPTLYSACKWAISYCRPQGWSALYPQRGHGWQNTLANAIALDKRLS